MQYSASLYSTVPPDFMFIWDYIVMLTIPIAFG